MDDGEQLMTPEAYAMQEREARAQAERAMEARSAMSPEDRSKIEAVAVSLQPYCLCQFCSGILLEPWLVKDCGHLYCFKCLHTMIYEQQAKACPACGGPDDGWNQDSFGAFKVVATADNARRIGREGSKFMYDDSTDHLVRLMWPERVEAYIHIDLDREQRRLEDIAARKHFEVNVQMDRLANPSMANPGMARAARDRRSGTAGTIGAHHGGLTRRPGTRIKAPPLKLTIPITSPGFPPERWTAADSHVHTLLLMPIHNTASERMRAWAQREGLLTEDLRLPALLKPYMRVPLACLTVGALKETLATLLRDSDHWHDRLHEYPATQAFEAKELALFVDWTQEQHGKTDPELLEEDLPDESEVAPFLQPGQGVFSMYVMLQYLAQQHVTVEPTLDLVYCLRPANNDNRV